MTSTSSSSINAELESAGGGYLNGIPSWQSAALNITALATLSLSILACVVLVVLVARSRKYATVADRFPLYLATLKLCWSIPHMIDHVYTVLHNAEYPPPTMCTAIGAILMFFMAIELVLTSVMSFAMMLSVMWGVPLNFGRGDVGLWALTCSGPLIWIVCAVYYDAFGADIYWCLFNMNGPHWRIFSIISAVFSIVVVVTPIVCGLVVFRRVQRVWHSSRVIYSGTSPPEDISLQSIKTAIVRKITQFETVTVITFLPSAAYCIMIATTGQVPFFLALSIALLVNLGGVMLCVVYIVQGRQPTDQLRSRSGDVRMGNVSSQGGSSGKGGGGSSSRTRDGGSSVGDGGGSRVSADNTVYSSGSVPLVAAASLPPTAPSARSSSPSPSRSRGSSTTSLHRSYGAPGGTATATTAAAAAVPVQHQLHLSPMPPDPSRFLPNWGAAALHADEAPAPTTSPTPTSSGMSGILPGATFSAATYLAVPSTISSSSSSSSPSSPSPSPSFGSRAAGNTASLPRSPEAAFSSFPRAAAAAAAGASLPADDAPRPRELSPGRRQASVGRMPSVPMLRTPEATEIR